LKFFKCKDPELIEKLCQYEKQESILKYKFGVLYCKEGQVDENEMFSNVEASPEYDEFLSFIGTKIELKGWESYRGGLDIKTNTTGTHSVYTKFCNIEIMFHVSTLLPFQPDDLQRVERKRHLGNDIVVLVFKEGEQPFDPLCLTTHFNNIFIVISVDKETKAKTHRTHYKLAIANKTGMPPYPPFLKEPAIYEKNGDFRNFLLTKLLNSERSSMYAPDFKGKMMRTRKTLLENMAKEFKEKKTDQA